MEEHDTISVDRKQFEFLCAMAAMVVFGNPKAPARERAKRLEGLRTALGDIGALEAISKPLGVGRTQ